MAARTVPHLLLAGLWLLFQADAGRQALGADPERCGICGKSLGATIYTVVDKATRTKVFICLDCARCPDECYICGLTVRENYTRLADGRFLCARDAKTAVLTPEKADEIFADIRTSLERMFSRFLTLPTTNVSVGLVDRVNLYDELTVKGNDFECPDILGYIHSRTNHDGLTHSISLMSGLPLAEFQATCAHEYAHAWVFENVPAARRKSLSRDSHEGFCEMLAYLLMESLQSSDQMARMLRNTYTRGQIDLFLAAHKQYGMNDVVDWMQWGVSPRLKAADLGDIRNVEMPRPKSTPPTNLLTYGQTQTTAPTRLVLKGISSDRNKPLALINDRTFAAGETGKVRLGATNVTVRCLSVGPQSVRVRMLDTGVETELRLSDDAAR